MPGLAGEVVAHPVHKGIEVLHGKFGPSAFGKDYSQVVVTTSDVGVGKLQHMLLLSGPGSCFRSNK